MATIDEVLSRFDVDRRTPAGGFAKCPAHDDKRASLSISLADSGKILMKCFAGCNIEDVVQKAGLRMIDLAGPDVKASRNGHGTDRSPHIYYDYRDASGKVRYQTVRKTPKGFYQRRLEGTRWVNNMDGVERVIYKLPEWRAADPNEWRFVCEGEKDVERACQHGVIATCNVGGAGKWRSEYSDELRGLKVCILPHNDDAGRAHAEDVARMSYGKAADIRILALPNLAVKGDLYDWFDAGGTKEQLIAMAEAAVQWQPAGEKTELDNSATEKKASEEKKEDVVILPPIRTLGEMFRTFTALRPEVIHNIARQGETVNLIASPKVGKSMIVIDMALAIVTGGSWLGRFKTTQGKVLIIDNECHEETTTVRFREVCDQLKIPRNHVEEMVQVVNLRGHLIDIHLMKLIFDQFEPGQLSLVVIDALYRTLPEDCDENSNADMAKVYNAVDRYAMRLKSAVFALVHHASKGNQSGKSTTDVGSGAGSMGRATDTHIVFREHEEEGGVVVNMALRSFQRADPFCMRWKWPTFSQAGDLDPTRLKREKGAGGRRQAERPPKGEKPVPTTWTPERFADEIIGTQQRIQAEIEADAMAGGLTRKGARDMLDITVARGLVFRAQSGRNTKATYSTIKPRELPNLPNV